MAKAQSKRKQKPKLTPIAHRVLELVERFGEGSQRAFATKVGCSQALISKIATGQQDPGRELIKNILKLKGVDKDWFLDGIGAPPDPSVDDGYGVPVADALLPGLPATHRHLLTSRSEPVPKGLYRESVYAIAARCCEPAFSDSDERLFAEDRLIIDALPDRWKRNPAGLDGKLCVIALDGGECSVLSLRRVWASFDLTPDHLEICPDRALNDYRRVKEEMKREWELNSRFGRVVEFRPADQIPKRKKHRKEIPVESILGVAVQLIRAL